MAELDKTSSVYDLGNGVAAQFKAHSYGTPKAQKDVYVTIRIADMHGGEPLSLDFQGLAAARRFLDNLQSRGYDFLAKVGHEVGK